MQSVSLSTENLTLKIVDGVHPSIAMVTAGGKILLHNPYAATKNANLDGVKIKESEIGWVNTSKKINALYSGNLDPNNANELLFIGSETNLLAFGKIYYI